MARLRRASGVRRIGHAGTLDPLAEGVLVIAVGQATRVIEYLAGVDKAYEARVTFGVETDTYDAEGRVVAERSISTLTRGQVEAALAQFRGAIEQRPPAYSAISVGGKRLYELARAGQIVEAPVRRVEITRLDLTAWEPPVATLLVECSKGTYIRSLAHDLGIALGCGGHLGGLVRLRVGSFVAHNAVPLTALEEQMRSGTWQAVAVSPSEALAHLPLVQLTAEEAARMANGSAVPVGEVPPPASGPTRAYVGGTLVAIVRAEETGGTWLWRPEKVFAPQT